MENRTGRRMLVRSVLVVALVAVGLAIDPVALLRGTPPVEAADCDAGISILICLPDGEDPSSASLVVYFSRAPGQQLVGQSWDVYATSNYDLPVGGDPAAKPTITIDTSRGAPPCRLDSSSPGTARVTALGIGECRLVARATIVLDGRQVTDTANWTTTIVKNEQTITWVEYPGSLTVGRDAFIDVRSSSGLPVTLTVTGPCRVVSGTYVRALETTGRCVMTANQDGNDAYLPAPSSERYLTVVEIGQTNQYLGWTDTFRSAYWVGDTFTIGTVSTVDANWALSSIPVQYGASGACSIVGTTVTAGPESGTCTVTAFQPGDGVYYLPSRTLSLPITIRPASVQRIVWYRTPPASANVGASVSFSAYTDYFRPVNAAVEGPCTFTADPPTPAGQVPLAGGSIVGTGPGDCVITVSSPMHLSTGPTDPAISGASSTLTVVFSSAEVPDAPTAVSASNVRAGTVSVSFAAPAGDGGGAITSYRAVCSPTVTGIGVARSSSGTGSPLVVSGLTAGADYQCRVNATNGVGTGPGSAPSTVIVPLGVPGSPTAVSATTNGSGALSVSFTAPTSNGGSPITSYRAICTSSDGGASRWATGPSSPLTVAALTGGRTYTCAVLANSAAGTSAPSTSSTPVVVRSVPGPPTSLVATRISPSRASVSFSAPTSDGGSAITSFRVVCTATSGGHATSSSASRSPIVVVALLPGTDYTCRASATNAVGTSTASGAVPLTAPAI